MNRSTSDYVFWEMNPDSERQRGIGGEKVNEGMRSKVIGSWWIQSTIIHVSSAWTDHGESWLTGSSTRYQYYWHIQYNYSTQPQYFRWDNFHYSMYSKYCNTCNTCCTPSNSLLVELVCSQVFLTCTCESTVQARQRNIFQKSKKLR